MSVGGPGTGGKPTVLTPEVRKRILEALRVGSPRGAAAARAGVGARTMRDWMARTDDVEPFASFRVEVEEAEGLCELQLAGVAFKGALGNPALAMRFLAMRFPGTWGRRGEKPSEPPAEEADVEDPPGTFMGDLKALWKSQEEEAAREKAARIPPWKKRPAPDPKPAERPFWEEDEPTRAGGHGE